MFNAVQDYTQQLWTTGRKVKKSQGGWLSGNAVCCHHNGENSDTRGRGGLILGSNGSVSWHCFNCNFKTGYTPGYPLSFKFRRLLKWMGANENEIQRLVFEALRVKDLIKPEELVEEVREEISFEPRALPAEARSFGELATFMRLQDEDAPLDSNFTKAVNFVYERLGPVVASYNFYWTPEVENKMSHRIIIPFYYKQQLMGYTARAVVDGIKPKYHTNHPPHFVFNLDNQKPDSRFVIVCEGPFDAMSVDGVSVQTNQISEQQAELIDGLGKEVIYVPDFDKHLNNQGKEVWAGAQAIEQAIDYGWSVSFPVWHETCKDINEALQKYGKLFTLKAILEGKESNPLKIKIKAGKI